MEKFSNFSSDQELECCHDVFSKGNDLIHFLVKNAKNNLGILKNYLITFPDKINLQNDKLFTPLMIACYYSNTTSSLECVKLLLNNGALTDIKNELGWTALTFASCYSKTTSSSDCVKLLLNNDCDINVRDRYGSTELMIVCSTLDTTSTIECLQLLLKYGADPNLKNRQKSTPLMILKNRTTLSPLKLEIAKKLFEN